MEALVEPSAVNTDREAFAAFVAPHWEGMARLAARLAPSGEWEDVLQEALVAAWRKRSQYDDERGTARNWLLAIVADQCRKGHRRRFARREQLLTDLPLDEPDRSAEADLDRALLRLTDRQRAVVALHYYLGLPVADVGAVLGVSAGTVKSTLSDARERLRSELGEEYR